MPVFRLRGRSDREAQREFGREFGHAWAKVYPPGTWGGDDEFMRDQEEFIRDQAAYQWLREHQRTGISADEYMDRFKPPTATGEMLGLLETIGRCKGAARGLDDGLLIEGRRRWSQMRTRRAEDGYQDFEEDASYRLPWGVFTNAKWRKGGAELYLDAQPETGMGLMGVVLSEFGQEGPARWLALLARHGIPVEAGSKSAEGQT